jgi:ABC-2 type transport system ATP-binding protein
LQHAIRLNLVTKRFGQFTAVDELSLDVPAGRIMGFLGPNGAGKTTSIRMMMSIIYPDSGSLEILGHPRAVEVKDRIGYLPEERGLYRRMTVEHTLTYFGRLKGLHGGDLRSRIHESLKKIELQDWLRKPVESLSKGMQQKLQFIATILHDPELVILDEPFSGLDPLNMELLKNLMLELKARGRTVIFSTHQMENAQRLCDRLVLINRGRKLIEGGVDEVRSRFASRIVTLDGEGDFRPLASRPGVLTAQVTDGHARIELDERSDPQELIAAALAAGRISRFEVQRPDLHEIFVKLVGADAAQRGAAGAPGRAVAEVGA